MLCVGRKKKVVEGPKVDFDEVTKKMEGRGGQLEEKCATIDKQLTQIKQKMKRTKPKSMARKTLQNRARQLLMRRKMYSKNRDQLYAQQFNMDQTKFAKESMENTKQMVGAMKQAKESLKSGIKEIDIDDVEDLQDDMEELLEDNDEIQEILGRAYGVPEEIDEDELMDELNALEDEMIDEEEETEETPDYLVSAASAANTRKLEVKGQEEEKYANILPETKREIA